MDFFDGSLSEERSHLQRKRKKENSLSGLDSFDQEISRSNKKRKLGSESNSIRQNSQVDLYNLGEGSSKNNNVNKGKIAENEIKHDLHFYANTMKERQMIVKENLQNKKGNKIDIRMRNDLQNLNDKINNLFNCFFDYYEKNKDKMK